MVLNVQVKGSGKTGSGVCVGAEFHRGAVVGACLPAKAGSSPTTILALCISYGDLNVRNKIFYKKP